METTGSKKIIPSGKKRQRLCEYLQRIDKPCTAIFDVGSRAVRILVAPKEVQTGNWQPRDFFNDSLVTHLGQEIDIKDKSFNLDSRATQNLLAFLKNYRELLLKYEIKEKDIHAVGTEVFRWIKNKDRITRYIKQKAGIDISILDDDDEARFSLVIIKFTYLFRSKKRACEFTEDNAVVLIDQGGGSTEISYGLLPEFSEFARYSFSELGTVALQNKFFYLKKEATNSQKEEYHDNPSTNQNRISNQNDRIEKIIDDTIENWSGYPKIKDKKLHIFAMGSAITACYPKYSNYKVHNKEVIIGNESQLSDTRNRPRMLEIIKTNCFELDTSKQQVRTLYAELREEEQKQRGRLRNKLVTLYGLPIYIKLLKKFKQDKLYICGYGLRYGVYVWLYHYQRPML